jgi:hypothetical protein
MYATAHWDLVRATAEAQRAAHRLAAADHAPATPAKVTTWGPRASRRGAEQTATIIRIPEQRLREAAVHLGAGVLLDA